jgi:tetratricopeptide (TPR) repeat protein
VNPGDDLALSGLASVMQAKGKIAKALDFIKQAIILNPYKAGYRFQQSQILLSAGRNEEALIAFWAAARLEPNAQKLSDFAWTMHLESQDGAAVQGLRQALASKPGDAKTEIRLAWILATSPDATLRNGPEAVRLASEALRAMRPIRSPELLDVLAVAQAAAGQYMAAQTTLKEAITNAADHPPAYQAMLQAQLTALKQSQPWRDRPAASNTASQNPQDI